jgi:hypothetical protein
MKKSKYTEEQIASALKQAGATKIFKEDNLSLASTFLIHMISATY